jgi:hypothetical protein
VARLLPLLFYAQQLFSLWMTVDAARRRADGYWYLIIWVPFGEWFYFFSVKIHDYPRLKVRLKDLFKRQPSLETLRHQADHNPCVANKLLLADALHDHGHYREAVELYQTVLERDPRDHAALHGCALAQNRLGEQVAAAEQLERLIELAPAFRGYAAYQDLAQTYHALGRKEAAVQILRALVAKLPQFQYEVLLAEALIEIDQRSDARSLLQRALDHFKHAPAYQRRRQGRIAMRARKLLKLLE